MLKINNLKLHLHPALQANAPELARQIAAELGNINITEPKSIEKISVGPLEVSSSTASPALAKEIAMRIHTRIEKAENG